MNPGTVAFHSHTQSEALASPKFIHFRISCKQTFTPPFPLFGREKIFQISGDTLTFIRFGESPSGLPSIESAFFLKTLCAVPKKSYLYFESFILISDIKFPTIMFQEILYKKSGTYYISEKVVWCKDMRGSVCKLPNLFNTECIVQECIALHCSGVHCIAIALFRSALLAGCKLQQAVYI